MLLDRYFLVSYSFFTSTKYGFGNVHFISRKHPSHAEIKDMISKNADKNKIMIFNMSNVVFLNIHEFKSEADYKYYIGEGIEYEQGEI